MNRTYPWHTIPSLTTIFCGAAERETYKQRRKCMLHHVDERGKWFTTPLRTCGSAHRCVFPWSLTGSLVFSDIFFWLLGLLSDLRSGYSSLFRTAWCGVVRLGVSEPFPIIIGKVDACLHYCMIQFIWYSEGELRFSRPLFLFEFRLLCLFLLGFYCLGFHYLPRKMLRHMRVDPWSVATTLRAAYVRSCYVAVALPVSDPSVTLSLTVGSIATVPTSGASGVCFAFTWSMGQIGILHLTAFTITYFVHIRIAWLI